MPPPCPRTCPAHAGAVATPRSKVYDGFYDIYRELYSRLADLYPKLDTAVEHVADQEGVV